MRRGLATYEPGSMEGWLSRITTNAFLDEVRRRKRRPLDAWPRCPSRASRVEGDPESRPGPDQPARRRPGRARGACPTSTAPPSCCATSSGYDYAEIARQLDVPIGTVRSRIHRGRAQLRKALAS